MSESGVGSKGMALVCIKDKDISEFLTQALKGMDFEISQAQSDQDALEKMKFSQFDIIFIEEGFGGSLRDDRVLAEIQAMPPVQRRKIFVALVGDKWETGDEMLGFTLSVNLLVNKGNLGQIKDCLPKFISQNKKFYKVFHDCQIALGKA